ncbi:hypothetical protein M413DRAFT_84386 [Hebeloma cylindrosporum]|uniref:Uncharacterized protein n=1 Tax=Hebeloma cylindrosporum TaxID=76867 RepID=A0A0C3CJ42_HEBCY|nr:hypothetical protein M413DRAFT_84386 [Hebeloma cylindrosporum h7]
MLTSYIPYILNPDPPVRIVHPQSLPFLLSNLLGNHNRVVSPFLLKVLVGVCGNISHIPGVLYSRTNETVGVFMTEQDFAKLKDLLLRLSENQGPNPNPHSVPIPEHMYHPEGTLLEESRSFEIVVSRPKRPPATQNQMYDSSLHAPSPSSHPSSSSSRQTLAQRPIPLGDPVFSAYSQNTSLPTSNYGQLGPGLGLDGAQAQQRHLQQRLDYSSSVHYSAPSPVSSLTSSHQSPGRLYAPLPGPSRRIRPLVLDSPSSSSRVPSSVPLHPVASSSNAPSRTRRRIPAAAHSQVGVSRLSRLSTPIPQTMGMNVNMNAATTRYSSPYPHPGFLSIPETPTTARVPSISQSLNSAGRLSGPGTPDVHDFFPGTGGNSSSCVTTPATAVTPAVATPGAAAEGYECGSGSSDDDPNAWRILPAKVTEDGVSVPPMVEVPIRDLQDIREMTGDVDNLHRQTTTTTGLSNAERRVDGTSVLPRTLSDSEGGLLLLEATVAGGMECPPVLAYWDSVFSNWDSGFNSDSLDEHANTAADANADVANGDNVSSGSGPVVLPRLFSQAPSAGSASSNVVARNGLDFLDGAVSGGVPLVQMSSGAGGPSFEFSAGLSVDVNNRHNGVNYHHSTTASTVAATATAVARNNNNPSSSSNAPVRRDDEAYIASVLRQQLDEFDSWCRDASFAAVAPAATAAADQSGVVDAAAAAVVDDDDATQLGSDADSDVTWIEAMYAGYDEKSVFF